MTPEEQDAKDDALKVKSEKQLRGEFGTNYKRMVYSINHLFIGAPGGSDPRDENSFLSRFLGGRTVDGALIGNDPEIILWLAHLRGWKTDRRNEKKIIARIIGGTMSDGSPIGTNPDFVLWITSPEWRNLDSPTSLFQDTDVHPDIAEIAS